MNDKSSNTKCCFAGKCFYCDKVGQMINECCNKKAAAGKAKVAIDEENEQENEQVELALDSAA